VSVSNHLAKTIYSTVAKNNADGEEMVTLLGAPSPSAFVPQYTVDNSITDSAVTASALVFSSIKLAIEHAESAGETEISLTVMMNGTPYVWDGADSGFAVASGLSVDIYGTAEVVSAGLVGIHLTGVFPAAAGTFPRLAFSYLTVRMLADVTIGQNRQFSMSNVYWNGNIAGVNGVCTIDFADVVIFAAYISATTFTGPALGYFGVTLIQVKLLNSAFNRTAYFSWSSGTVRQNGTAFGVVTPDAGLTSDIDVTGVTVDVNDPAGTGVYTVFDAGVNGVFRARGVEFCKSIPSTGITLYNATAAVVDPVGVITFPANAQQNVAVPLSGNPVTVPVNVRTRLVYGDVTLDAAALVPAFWTIEVETGIGTGLYDIVLVPTAPAASPTGKVDPFCFSVNGGRKYRFTAGGGLGVTETISHYSYTE
jgi:hypothetical protein